MLVVKGCHNNHQLFPNFSTSLNGPNHDPIVIDPSKDELQILEGQETLMGLQANGTSSRNQLVCVYYIRIYIQSFT